MLGWVLERGERHRACRSCSSASCGSPWARSSTPTSRSTGVGNAMADGGVCATLRDVARFGQLWLDRGVVDGRQLVPEAWIRDTLRAGPTAARPTRRRAAADFFPGALLPQQALDRAAGRAGLRRARHQRPVGLRPRAGARRAGQALDAARPRWTSPSSRPCSAPLDALAETSREPRARPRHPARRRARAAGTRSPTSPGVAVGLRRRWSRAQRPVRTGVTAIHPRGRDAARDPVAAGFHVLNGNGEMTGTAWIEESGTISLPIAITNTHAVGIGARARSSTGWRGATPTSRERWLAAGGRRDLGRLPQRHQRRARHARARARGARRGRARPGGRGLRRRRHRHVLLRLQGRQRHAPRASWPSGDARLYRRRAGAGQLRRPRPSSWSPACPVGRELADDDPMADVDTWRRRPAPAR